MPVSSQAVFAEKRRRGLKTLQADLLSAAMVAAGSLGIGLLVNALRPHPLSLVYAPPNVRLVESVARISAKSSATDPQTAASGQCQSINLDDFQDFVLARKGLIIDARSQILYQKGHVPGAVNLPREDFEQRYSQIRALAEPEKERAVVVYCSEADCKDSELVADALGRLGFRRLFIYREGWEEWQRAGLPQATDHSL